VSPADPGCGRIIDNFRLDSLTGLIRAGELDLLTSLARLEEHEFSITSSSSSALSCSTKLRHHLADAALPYPSWAYLAYYKLGIWLIGGAHEQAPAMSLFITDICNIIRSDKPTSPVAFGDPSLASERVWQSVLNLFQEGGDFLYDLEAPSQHSLDHWCTQISAVHRLIARLDPDLSVLMAQLQNLIILSAPGPLSQQAGIAFGGATCFFFRGATLLNASRPISKVQMLELLVHEYAHAELFVLGQEQPLCLNSDEECYPVLIRSDPRPMNGIIHSLYVVGRVVEILKKLLKDGIDGEPDREVTLANAQDMLSRQLNFGRSSLRVVEQHADLTLLGQSVLVKSRKQLAPVDSSQ
jgi:hypothetical protein